MSDPILFDLSLTKFINQMKYCQQVSKKALGKFQIKFVSYSFYFFFYEKQ